MLFAIKTWCRPSPLSITTTIPLLVTSTPIKSLQRPIENTPTMLNTFKLTLEINQKFVIPPLKSDAEHGPPCLAAIKNLLLEKWPDEWTLAWLNSLDLDEEQWMGMAMLSTLTTAAKAQVQLNRVRNDRLAAECVERKLEGEVLAFHLTEGIKSFKAVDMVCAVEECERDEAKMEEK